MKVSNSEFIGDCMKMIRFVADTPEVDDSMMAKFKQHMEEGYDDLLRELCEKRNGKCLK